MKTILLSILAVFAMFAAAPSALAQNAAAPAPRSGTYTSNTVNTGAAGGQTSIEVDVDGTTGTTYDVYVNGTIVKTGTVPDGGSKHFTINVSALPANANVQVKGSTSGSGDHSATISLS